MLWQKNNKLVQINDKIIDCDHCPCNGNDYYQVVAEVSWNAYERTSGNFVKNWCLRTLYIYPIHVISGQFTTQRQVVVNVTASSSIDQQIGFEEVNTHFGAKRVEVYALSNSFSSYETFKYEFFGLSTSGSIIPQDIFTTGSTGNFHELQHANYMTSAAIARSETFWEVQNFDKYAVNAKIDFTFYNYSHSFLNFEAAQDCYYIEELDMDICVTSGYGIKFYDETGNETFYSMGGYVLDGDFYDPTCLEYEGNQGVFLQDLSDEEADMCLDYKSNFGITTIPFEIKFNVQSDSLKPSYSGYTQQCCFLHIYEGGYYETRFGTCVATGFKKDFKAFECLVESTTPAHTSFDIAYVEDQYNLSWDEEKNIGAGIVQVGPFIKENGPACPPGWYTTGGCVVNGHEHETWADDCNVATPKGNANDPQNFSKMVKVAVIWGR